MLSTDELMEIVDYVENFDNKNIEFVILGTIGRCGSTLLHSLLDNHPHILHIPTAFYYFSDWEYILQYSTPDALGDDFFEKSDLLPGQLHSHIPNLGINRDITLDLQLDKLRQAINQVLPYLSNVNRRTFILLIHFTFAKLFSINLEKVTTLLFHNHSVPNIFGYYSYIALKERYVKSEDVQTFWYLTPNIYGQEQDYFLERLLQEFPRCKFLVSIRNPMSLVYASGGYIEGGNILAPELANYYWASYHMPLGYCNLYALKKKLGEQLLFVRFEDLHCETEATMRSVASFMNVPYQESLLESTFGGYLWSGSIVTSKIIFGTNPEIVQRDTQKWRKHLDPYTQEFYIEICNPIARAFGYESYPSHNTLKDFSAFIPQENKTYRDYPTYLLYNYSSAVNDIRYTPESTSMLAPHDIESTYSRFELYQQRMLFWKEYPAIRNEAIQALLQAGRELEQSPSLYP